MISLNNVGQSPKKIPAKVPVKDYAVKIVRFAELEKVIKKNDNKLYVVNFWATWCMPCVQELPDFMDVNKMYQSNPNFKMILVSLDMASDVESAVRPFLKKNKMDVNVYLLDDNKHMNDWIPAVDKQWTGAIPATVLYRNGVKLAFRESKIGKIELVELIRNYL